MGHTRAWQVVCDYYEPDEYRWGYCKECNFSMDKHSIEAQTVWMRS